MGEILLYPDYIIAEMTKLVRISMSHGHRRDTIKTERNGPGRAAGEGAHHVSKGDRVCIRQRPRYHPRLGLHSAFHTEGGHSAGPWIRRAFPPLSAHDQRLQRGGICGLRR